METTSEGPAPLPPGPAADGQRRRPTFSVVTPTCRRPELLARAIASVLGQTYPGFEHVIVDDAGEERTEALVRSFGDPRLVLVRHERQAGAAAAYNSGVRAARGELITFLDDDDEYLPAFMERTLSFLEAAGDGIGFVWTGIARVADTAAGERLLLERRWPARFASREEALVAATTIGNGFGLAVRARCLEEVGPYDEGFPVCEDTELLFRLAARFDCAVVPEVLVRIHQHPGPQLTDAQNLRRRLETHERLLGRHAALLEEHPPLAAVHLAALAGLCYRTGQRGRGRRLLLDAARRRGLSTMDVADLLCYETSGADFLTWWAGSRWRRGWKRLTSAP